MDDAGVGKDICECLAMPSGGVIIKFTCALQSLCDLSLPSMSMFRATALTKSLVNANSQQLLRSGAAAVQLRGYHEKVISHYEKPRNVRAQSSMMGLSDNSTSSFQLVLCSIIYLIGRLAP